VSDFLAMGGYGFYVWSSYGITALVIVVELISLRARRHAAIEEAQLAGPDTTTRPPALDSSGATK
jgi:heme exporter protein D